MQKFDEMYAMLPFDGSDVRSHYKSYAQWLARQSQATMQARQAEAEMIFRRVGITFAVYGDKDESGAGTERLIPFDLIPRIIPAGEWQRMQQGLVQRVTALNRFIADVYNGQEILQAGIVPRDLIDGNSQFRPEMRGLQVPGGIYAHIAGIDIVRAPNAQGEGEYFVLEDNLRVPSGVSYMLENRKMMMRLFPDLFTSHAVEPVAHYPDMLLDTLRASAPSSAAAATATVVVLTPGMYNSAYFEHAFLARHSIQPGIGRLDEHGIARAAGAEIQRIPATGVIHVDGAAIHEQRTAFMGIPQRGVAALVLEVVGLGFDDAGRQPQAAVTPPDHLAQQVARQGRGITIEKGVGQRRQGRRGVLTRSVHRNAYRKNLPRHRHPR